MPELTVLTTYSWAFPSVRVSRSSSAPQFTLFVSDLLKCENWLMPNGLKKNPHATHSCSKCCTDFLEDRILRKLFKLNLSSAWGSLTLYTCCVSVALLFTLIHRWELTITPCISCHWMQPLEGKCLTQMCASIFKGKVVSVVLSFLMYTPFTKSKDNISAPQG